MTGRVGRRALLGRGALAAVAVATLTPVDLAGAAPPATDDGALDLKSFGATGDGTTDDGPFLKAAITQLVANGGGTLQVTNGIYRIATPVLVGAGGKAASIVIRGLGSSTQFLIASGSSKAITLQNLESVLIDNMTFAGTLKVATDALVALEFDSCIQATLRRCDFYGVSSTLANGAVVFANGTDLRIEDSAFRGCGASAGIKTSVVASQNWTGLTIVKTDFIDYGYLNGVFYSKTPIAAPYAWVGLFDTAATQAPPVQGAVLLSNINMDEGALLGFACLPSATSGVIESVTITGLRINVAGFLIPNNGLLIQGVEHVLVERCWFGYGTGYSVRNAISLRSVTDAVIDSCRCSQQATRIVADSACGTVTVRETTATRSTSPLLLLSDAASTQVIQGGLTARLLKADTAIAANSLVTASPTNPLRVILAPAGAAPSAILGVALDATVRAGDYTRVVMTRGLVAPVVSDGTTTIALGDPVGPSQGSAGLVAKVSSGGVIGRVVQVAPSLAVELLDRVLESAAPSAAPLQNGWANLAGYAPATYAKTADGRVQLSGVITGGATAAGTVIFVLPAGFRPPATVVFPVATGVGYAEVSVDAAGNVTARTPVSAGYTSLSGILFAAA